MLSQDMPNLTYFKRFRMEIDVQGPLPLVPALPPGYTWSPWEARLLDYHADVKSQCFNEELDAVIFPSLSSREGCLRLMRDITENSGFKPEATWLIAHEGQYCGTIQGV